MAAFRRFAGLIIGSILLLNSAAIAAVTPAASIKIPKFPKSTPTSLLSKLSTASLSAIRLSDLPVNDARGNIGQLLDAAVRNGRVNEIESVEYLQRFQNISERGDAVLLECLRHNGCELADYAKSSALKPASKNQLHLMHLARCPNCNLANIYKLSGDTTESLMHSFFKRGGWQQLQGEIGNSGIDGLYVKRSMPDVVTDVLIVEAKYNTSQLAETRTGTQMSKSWIKSNLAKLKEHAALNDRSEDVNLYGQIEKYVDAESYRAQEWRINVIDDKIVIDRTKISSKGATISREPYFIVGSTGNDEARIEINIVSPASKFDRDVVADYWKAINTR